MFEEEVEQDVMQFGQRMNARQAEPAPPKQTVQTEIFQLNPEQSRRFISIKDDQLGFKYLRDTSSSGNGN